MTVLSAVALRAAVLVIAGVYPALAQDSASPVVSVAIAERYLAVAESAGTAPPATRSLWQRRIDSAHDTLQSVLEWNNRSGRSSSSLRMLVALGRFWNGDTYVGAFERALAAPVAHDSTLRARALNSAAAALPDQGSSENPVVGKGEYRDVGGAA
ncbi:hypothetical protein BH11GEM1_BH11GEM1_21460 [soil metagenome]